MLAPGYERDTILKLRLVDEREESMRTLAELKESITVCIQLLHATEQAVRAKEEGGMQSVLLEAQLKGKAKAQATLKRQIYALHETLHNSIFAEEFIANKGMDVLQDIFTTMKGNTQAYALKAIYIAMGYANGLDRGRYSTIPHIQSSCANIGNNITSSGLLASIEHAWAHSGTLRVIGY